MNNNDYREITEDDVTTVSTDQKEEMNGQESVNDPPDVSENEKETVQAEVTNSDASDEKEPEYEDICYICRRPEHIAGKMIKIPNNICICQDCMQKTFDSMNQTGFSTGQRHESAEFCDPGDLAFQDCTHCELHK